MTAPRVSWRRLERLVGAALAEPTERRAAFLATATRDEPVELRREAESLVAHGSADPSFLTRVADEIVTPVVAAALESELPRPYDEVELGESIAGRYRIEERTGGGGMGVVYRATDTRLGRVVALKLLPRRTRADPVARRRFVQEARAASALDHPNIGTVFDILEVAEGRDCIAMAHYEGTGLVARLQEGPLDLSSVVRVGGQIARALEAAHAGGVIHCDVKPGNVLLTEAGVVKLVDFGLARFTDRGRSSATAPRGTVPYMAPEQLRGASVTPATDVWALGVTLFEMATGRRPFEGADPGEIARGILENDPPPPSSVRSELPRGFDDLVLACLRKKPSDRPSSSVVRGRLADASPTPRAGVIGEPDGSGPFGKRTRARLGVAVVGLSIAALVLTTGPAWEAPSFTRPRQLSAAEGVEDFPVWSPEGDALLYQATTGGEVFGGTADVMLRELDAELPRNLTADHDGFDGRPSWSPDGDRFAFYSQREGGGYFIQGMDEDEPRKVWDGRPLGGAHNAAVWSPDGTELAVTVDGRAEGARLEVVSAGDGELLRTVPLPGRPGNLLFGTAWSPDGRFVAVADAMNLTPDEARLWIVRLDDGRALPVTEGQDLAWSPSWAPDARALFFVSDRGGGRDLWVQPLDAEGRPDGEPEGVTTGVGIRNAALSGDAARLAYSQGRIVAHAWRVPILEDRTAGWEDAQPMTSDRAYVEFVEVDPVEGTLYVSSDRAGGQDVWSFDGPGSAASRLTSDDASDWAPMLAPDGTRIAYYSARSGNRDVWIQSLTGDEPPRQITDDDAIDFVPSWSPDGRSLVFASGRTGNLDVWTVDLDRGTLRQLTEDPGMDAWPHWSPDGRTIVFRSNRDGRWRLWEVPVEGGTPSVITEVSATYFRWSGDGETLYLVSQGQLWSHDLDTGEERPLTSFEDRSGTPGVVALATDDRYLYFTWEEDIGDLWMMERGRR